MKPWSTAERPISKRKANAAAAAIGASLLLLVTLSVLWAAGVPRPW